MSVLAVRTWAACRSSSRVSGRLAGACPGASRASALRGGGAERSNDKLNGGS